VNGCNDGKVIADAIRTILTNPNNKRIVITGKPDTGKTLLLKTKAMELLNANVNTKMLYVINPQNPRRVLDLDVSQIRNRQKNQKKICQHAHTCKLSFSFGKD
jgi:Cdc6-like AAA superfamily ATPase